MNRVEGYITAHIGDNINECDDNFSISFDKCSFAVADGSSSDFFRKYILDYSLTLLLRMRQICLKKHELRV